MAALSLRVKWSLALLGVATVPLALVSGASVRIQRAGLERAEAELQLAAIDQASQVVTSQLDAIADATHRVGRLLTEGRIEDDEVRLSLAGDAVGRVAGLDYVAIYGPEGDYVDALVPGDAPRKVEPPPHLDGAARSTASAAWIAAPGGAAGETFFVEPMRAGSELRGWALARVAPGRLSALVAGVSRDRFNAADRVSILDADGRRVAGAETEAAAGDEQRILARIHAAPQAFETGIVGTTEFPGASGEPMVGSLRTLPAYRWALVVRRPEREAYAELGQARTAFAAAAATFALVAAALGVWLGARGTRPIRSLIELTRAYGRREFEARSTVRTGDELEQLGLALTNMADSLIASDREIARRAKVEAGLARYLPESVARDVAAGTQPLELGGRRRAATVLFADVVAFTGFAEASPPERVVTFLNELFTILSEVVFRHGGMVDKFMGDCVMAVFGVTDAEAPDHVVRAVRAAEDMQRFAEASAPAWKESFGLEVSLGIGVGTGEVLVGNLGSEMRMEFTAIGDAVNVAARLETLARPGQILVTGAVARAVGEASEFRSLGEHPLRGKKQPVEVLEVARS